MEAPCAPSVPSLPIRCQKARQKMGGVGVVSSFSHRPSNSGSRDDETAPERVRQDFMWERSCSGKNCAASFSRSLFFTAGGWWRCCREEPSLVRSSRCKPQLSDGSMWFGWTWFAPHCCDEPATALKGFKEPVRNLYGLLHIGGSSWCLYGMLKRKKKLHCVKVLQKANVVKCWFQRKYHFNVFPKYTVRSKKSLEVISVLLSCSM